MKIRVAVVVLGLVSFVPCASRGQMTSMNASVGTDGRYSITAQFAPPSFSLPAISGAPYSADQVSEHIQTLNDGTHVSQPPPGTLHMYRDSAGRTRTERPFIFGPRGQTPGLPLLVEINDPVAGYQLILDTVNRVAHRSALPPRPERARAAPLTGGVPGGSPTGRIPGGVISSSAGTVYGPAAAGAPPGFGMRPDVSSESLGTQVIEGILVEGRLSKVTHPVGTMGNDRPIVTTSEDWMSPELRVMVLSKSSDPRSGEHTTRLININRAEPDPGLFQVPPDYQIVDETGPFTIKIERP